MAKARAAPHSKSKAAARVLSPDDEWAAGIRERILADCHPWQRMAVEDPSRRVSLLVGRGGAKTTSFRARAAIKMTGIRRADLLYLATTEDHARELNWDPLQDMNEHYGLELRFNKSELAATCKRTGSRYVMGGMETDADIEKYRGKSRNEVQVDEAASHAHARLHKLLKRIVGPRLGDRQGCIAIGGTPGHELAGEFYDATRPGSERHAPYADRNRPGYERRYWSSHAWSLKQVADLPDAKTLYPALVALWAEALIDKAEERWSDSNPIWMREHLGLWASDDTDTVFRYRAHLSGEEAAKRGVPDGTPWNQWDPLDGHKLEGIQALRASIVKLREMGFRDLRFVVPGDMGHTDPFALGVLAFSPTDPQRNIWHAMGFEQTAMYAKPIAELLVGPDAVERILRGAALEPMAGVLGETGWPDGMVMDADGATIDELKNVYGIGFKKAERNPGYKQGAIELTNGDLVDGRIKVIKGSVLEQQLGQLQWREDQFGRVKEDPRQPNHSTDYLVYGRKMIAGLFESGAVEGATPAAAAGPVPARTAPRPQAREAEPPPGISTDREFEGLLASPGYVDIWGNG